MTILDGFILLVVLLSTLSAASQGFFYEAFNLSGVIFGYLLAAWEYPRVAARLIGYVSSQWVADISAFLLIFFCVALLAGVLGRIVRWAIAGVGMRWFDRVLGGAFGLLRGFVIGTILVMAMASFDPTSSSLRDSALAPYFLVASRTATWIAPSDLRNKFRQGVAILWNAREKAPALSSQPKASK